MNKRPNYRFLQYLLYKVDVQNGGAWASTVNSKSMNLISTQKVYNRHKLSSCSSDVVDKWKDVAEACAKEMDVNIDLDKYVGDTNFCHLS